MSDVDVAVVREWPVPTCSKDVERFMGLVNYHRTSVHDFAQLAEPLYSVVGKKKFRWDTEQQEAFDALRQAVTEPPVLALPNQTDKFILDMDASEKAVGAELIQVQDGVERVIAYGSFALNHEQ
ncbi:uncharacterized protein LOC123553067 [Mercenaria mercenaria]|uniref:uncharacterized protein LOC123553067 n=1 Tax=Mercenaria mercenaria TaxID=6596 RepID=UPI001E1D79A3|nr:uncharacterized protein LOC123553067 [Mercenaria mercenaria]